MVSMNAGSRLDGVLFRVATEADVPQMAACRLRDPAARPADPRMTAYFLCQHHPQRALMPRTGYVALVEGVIVGYIAGHLTTRHRCAGEVQYLFVAPEFRRRGIATSLLRLMAAWFQEHAATKVCVCVDAGSAAPQPFYPNLRASPLS